MAAALLVFSPKCQHSMQLLQYIDTVPQLRQMVQVHNVNTHGVPPQYSKQISRVPTMLTKNGKILVGQEIKAWLESLLPNQLENHNLRGGNFASLDGTDDGDDGDMFSLDNYGQSLQPAITPELQAKMSQTVSNGSYSAN